MSRKNASRENGNLARRPHVDMARFAAPQCMQVVWRCPGLLIDSTGSGGSHIRHLPAALDINDPAVWAPSVKGMGENQ